MRRPAAAALGALAAFAALGGCSGEDAGGTPGTTAAPVVAAEPATTTTAVPEEAGRVEPAYVPRVGECFDERSRTDAGTGRETRYRLVVDCLLPHQHEVIAAVPVPGEPDAPYPGDEALRRLGRRACPPEFRAYVGAAYELSVYGLGYVVPTPEQWATVRVVGCTVTGPDGGRTAGSARDAAR